MPQSSALNSVQPSSIQCVFTIAASAPAGTVLSAVVYPLGTQFAGSSNPTVSPDEVWHIYDAYVVNSTLFPNSMVISLVIGTTPYPLNIDTAAMIAQNNTSRINPFASAPLTIPPNKSFIVQGQLDAANGTSQVVETLWLSVLREPLTMALQRTGAGAIKA